MANEGEHYRALAARSHAEAAATTRDNVRDRALRSAAAFEAMARQQERTGSLRAARAAATVASVVAGDPPHPDIPIPLHTPIPRHKEDS